MKTLFFRTKQECRDQKLPVSYTDVLLDDKKRICILAGDRNFNMTLTEEETLRFYEQLKEGLGL